MDDKNLNEKFNYKFGKLNNLNKQYIGGILQAIEFSQNIVTKENEILNKEAKERGISVNALILNIILDWIDKNNIE